MSTHKISQPASELINHIVELDARGQLDGATIQKIKEALETISAEARNKINDVTQLSSKMEWEKFNVSENFFHDLTREEWNVFMIYASNCSRFVSDLEVAEILFQTEQPTNDQIKFAQHCRNKIRFTAESHNPSWYLNLEEVMYRGKRTIGNKWEQR